MKLYDFGIAIICGLIVLLCGAAVSNEPAINKHLWGYEQAIKVENAEPLEYDLYYSMQVLEDKVWWDMSSVQERSAYLLSKCQDDPNCSEKLPSPVGAIACSADGRYLYTGVDE